MKDNTKRDALIADLTAAIAKATGDDLSDVRLCFHESCDDLTRCRHDEIGEYQHSADGELVELLWNNRANFVALLSRIGELEAGLSVGERFLNKCNSAWSCGEPYHRVKDMLDAADKFREALHALAPSEQIHD